MSVRDRESSARSRLKLIVQLQQPERSVNVCWIKRTNIRGGLLHRQPRGQRSRGPHTARPPCMPATLLLKLRVTSRDRTTISQTAALRPARLLASACPLQPHLPAHRAYPLQYTDIGIVSVCPSFCPPVLQVQSFIEYFMSSFCIEFTKYFVACVHACMVYSAVNGIAYCKNINRLACHTLPASYSDAPFV